MTRSAALNVVKGALRNQEQIGALRKDLERAASAALSYQGKMREIFDNAKARTLGLVVLVDEVPFEDDIIYAIDKFGAVTILSQLEVQK